MSGPALGIVVKGYPRLSETFIAQEMLGLEEAGLAFEIWSLRRPTDGAVHPVHRAIAARIRYLPEYLRHEPWRVLKGAVAALARRALPALLGAFVKDFARDPTRSRLRRLGQAFVLARELPPGTRHLHVHYLHTPASVVRYACLLSGRSFSFSAHAKDIWTTPDWDRREKIAASAWGVTCTAAGLEELRRCAGAEGGKVTLVYHGLDLRRFPQAPPPRAEGGPLRLVTVGRAVAKKGFDDLLAALALLPPDLDWRLVHVGAGELLPALRDRAAALGLAARVEFKGAQPQDGVVAALRGGDLFVLPCKEGDGGDRDGLPNVIMEAAAQGLPILSTRFAGVPEFVRDGREGVLVPPADPAALARAIEGLAREPERRRTLGAAARARVRGDFSFKAGIAVLADRLRRSLKPCPSPSPSTPR